MQKRPLRILDNCMLETDHNYRWQTVRHNCNNNILLHFPDIWYLLTSSVKYMPHYEQETNMPFAITSLSNVTVMSKWVFSMDGANI